VACRVCGASLVVAVERKLGRCEACPADRDEQLYEALRSWRAARAKELSQPAYCVFTDATLTAIAEQRPADVACAGRDPRDRAGEAGQVRRRRARPGRRARGLLLISIYSLALVRGPLYLPVCR
jgi:hypothetical protein